MIESHVDTRAESYTANRAALLELLAEHDRQLEIVNNGGGDKYVDRHRERGKLLVRERIELLLDRDAPFLELSPLAAWGTTTRSVPASFTGIGVVEGVECVIIANDPTVRGGTSTTFTVRKTLRAMEIARENRLPFVQLVESGGADLPHQSRDLHPRRPDVPRPHRPLGGRHPDRSRSSSATRPPAAPTCPGCATTS